MLASTMAEHKKRREPSESYVSVDQNLRVSALGSSRRGQPATPSDMLTRVEPSGLAGQSRGGHPDGSLPPRIFYNRWSVRGPSRARERCEGA